MISSPRRCLEVGSGQRGFCEGGYIRVLYTWRSIKGLLKALYRSFYYGSCRTVEWHKFFTFLFSGILLYCYIEPEEYILCPQGFTQQLDKASGQLGSSPMEVGNGRP